MDDVYGFGPDPQVEKFKEDLAAHIWFRDGGVHREGAEYDHLKRFRKRLLCWSHLAWHKEKLTTGELLTTSNRIPSNAIVRWSMSQTRERFQVHL